MTLWAPRVSSVVPIPQQPSWLVACVKILAGLSPQSLSVYEDFGGQALLPTLQPTLPSVPFLREATETWRPAPSQAQLSPTDLFASLPQQLPDVAVIRKLIYNTGRSQSKPIGASIGLLGSCLEILFMGKAGDIDQEVAQHRRCLGVRLQRLPSLSHPQGPQHCPFHGTSFNPGHIRQTQPLIRLPTQRTEKTPPSLWPLQFIFYSGRVRRE